MRKHIKSPFLEELIIVLKKYELWFFMAWVDIKLRYRRTILGPFWMVIVSFISIVCIAILGSLLFKVKFSNFFPYVTCGMVIWTYMAAMITDSCLVFLAQIGLIKNVNVSLVAFCLRMFVRNTIIFFHNLVIVFFVLLYYQVPIGWSVFMLIPGLFLFAINGITLSIILGFLCTRFRDILQLIQALIGILAFLTPIMWQPEMLGSKAMIAYFNPLTHYIAILREPLLGNYPSYLNWGAVSMLTIINIILAHITFKKFQKQLVHWL